MNKIKWARLCCQVTSQKKFKQNKFSEPKKIPKKRRSREKKMSKINHKILCFKWVLQEFFFVKKKLTELKTFLALQEFLKSQPSSNVFLFDERKILKTFGWRRLSICWRRWKSTLNKTSCNLVLPWKLPMLLRTEAQLIRPKDRQQLNLLEGWKKETWDGFLSSNGKKKFYLWKNL